MLHNLSPVIRKRQAILNIHRGILCSLWNNMKSIMQLLSIYGRTNGGLSKVGWSKVKAVLIFCLVLSVNSPWCRSSWQHWPSGRESRQQPKAWMSWPLPSLPRRKRPTESRKTPSCWWESSSHLHTDRTTNRVQELQWEGKYPEFS